ncbi:hypothetical protein [Nocardioides limicola]|uniref:hypothetical protein n=1 Tax=Nocardioides limicola TaxID=2803368 RepID=UPI00193C5B6F|nr:hypothetical protein [Nocardioides sp. DJM-14]
MTLRLDADTAEAITTRHDSAVSVIDDSATNAPQTIDGGEGTPFLLEILEAVGLTAAEIAAINQAVAILIRDTGDDLAQTEDALVARFTELNEGLR